MYDELIKALREHECFAREDDTQDVCEECAYDVVVADKTAAYGIRSVCTCGLMHKAADAIDELDTLLDGVSADNDALCETIERLKKPRWIPVTERLPEKYDSVIVYSSTGIMIDAYIGEFDGKAYFGMNTNRVTHWMPISAPPKEET